MAYPTLNSNSILKSLYNAAVVERVFVPDLDVDGLADKFRVDMGMYGDTHRYISADVMPVNTWTQDSTDACNVLAVKRPLLDEQVVVMDQFRQTMITLDEVISKFPFDSEGSFAQANAVLMGLLAQTKAVYDYATVATAIGLEKATAGFQSPTVAATATAAEIAQKIADIYSALKRPSRDYNDFGNMRAYSADKLQIIWNSAWVNKIKKAELPEIFHKEMLDVFDEGNVIDACYFGTINTAAKTGLADGSIRYLETTVVGSGVNEKVYFPGDAVPTGTSVAANKSYTVDANVICKIIGKGGMPYASGFTSNTSFVNARNNSTNYYLTFAHNKMAHLKDKPFISLSVATA